MKDADIIVTKANEVYLKIFCEPHIAEEISAFFTFLAPDHEWSPSFKAKRWDGKIRLYNKKTRQLYSGLFRYLIEFASSRKYEILFEGNVGLMTNYSLLEAEEYIKELNIHSKGKPLEPRDYQIVGFAKAIRYKRMLMLSPTASGKSYMIYCICRQLLTRGLKSGLVIVPTIGLVEQLKSDFRDYANGQWDVDANVHTIYGGQDIDINKPITISTWQSIYELKKDEFFVKFDFVIGDEAHGFKADSLKKIMTKLTNAQFRIGMTGTLDNWHIHKLMIEGYFGPVSKLTTTKRMIDEKQASDLQIKCITLKYPTSNHFAVTSDRKATLHAEMDYICANESRNKFIRNLALSLNGNTLILFQYIDKHGNILYKMLKEKADPNRFVFYVHGGTEVEEREAVRRLTEVANNAIIAASYGVFSTGVNIKNLHNIIFTSPVGKSRVRILQSIGRGLRLGENKTHLTVYDISDDFRINKYVNFTLKHFAERVKLYREEKFKVSFYTVDLK